MEEITQLGLKVQEVIKGHNFIIDQGNIWFNYSTSSLLSRNWTLAFIYSYEFSYSWDLVFSYFFWLSYRWQLVFNYGHDFHILNFLFTLVCIVPFPIRGGLFQEQTYKEFWNMKTLSRLQVRTLGVVWL